MSDNFWGIPSEPERPSRFGCGTLILGALGLGVAAIIALVLLGLWQQSRHDWQQMQKDSVKLGFDNWVSDDNTDVYVYHVFSGADSRYYRITLHPNEVGQFLQAVASRSKAATQPTRAERWLGSPAPVKWWTPNTEPDLLAIELKSSAGWTVWHVAVSPTTGNAYVERVGH